MSKGLLIPDERIEKTILLIRGQKVIIDADLAELYGVTTGNLNKAVKRNIDRFPNDFMFQLTPEEYKSLRFRFGILKKGRHSKYLPYAFTEQGVAMLDSGKDREDITDCDIIGEKQELVTSCDRLDRLYNIIRI